MQTEIILSMWACALDAFWVRFGWWVQLVAAHCRPSQGLLSGAGVRLQAKGDRRSIAAFAIATRHPRLRAGVNLSQPADAALKTAN